MSSLLFSNQLAVIRIKMDYIENGMSSWKMCDVFFLQVISILPCCDYTIEIWLHHLQLECYNESQECPDKMLCGTKFIY